MRNGKPKPRDAHVFPKAADGFYVEPQWCSDRLFDVEDFAPRVYDPACGWGTILRAAKTARYDVIGTDIVDRKQHRLGIAFKRADFLNDAIDIGRKTSIVCNPPFDHVEEFARRALELADKVAMIMLVRRLNAAHWLGDLSLRSVYLLTPRPSMPPGAWIAAGNTPGGGTQDFCWVVFEKNFRGKPQLRWLHRDAK
jgi:hypothetical protein